MKMERSLLNVDLGNTLDDQQYLFIRFVHLQRSCFGEILYNYAQSLYVGFIDLKRLKKKTVIG